MNALWTFEGDRVAAYNHAGIPLGTWPLARVRGFFTSAFDHTKTNWRFRFAGRLSF
jgi:hypothetical protein